MGINLNFFIGNGICINKTKLTKDELKILEKIEKLWMFDEDTMFGDEMGNDAWVIFTFDQNTVSRNWDRCPTGIVDDSKISKNEQLDTRNIKPYCFLMDCDAFYKSSDEIKYVKNRQKYIIKFIKTIMDGGNKELSELIVKLFVNDKALIVGKLCALWYS